MTKYHHTICDAMWNATTVTMGRRTRHLQIADAPTAAAPQASAVTADGAAQAASWSQAAASCHTAAPPGILFVEQLTAPMMSMMPQAASGSQAAAQAAPAALPPPPLAARFEILASRVGLLEKKFSSQPACRRAAHSHRGAFAAPHGQSDNFGNQIQRARAGAH